MFLNFKNIINTLGLGLIIEAIFMAFMLPFAVYYNEHLLLDESLAIIITLLFGGFLTFFSYQNKPQTHIILRENFITIVIIWLLLPTFGTLPYLLTGSIPNFTDAFLNLYRVLQQQEVLYSIILRHYPKAYSFGEQRPTGWEEWVL
jgi:trk system potassium uptake protein TrkH